MRVVKDNSIYILLTATEAAAMLRVPLPTLVDWQNYPGSGPDHLFIDGRMMFRLDILRDWIDAQSVSITGPDSGEQLEDKVQLGCVS